MSKLVVFASDPIEGHLIALSLTGLGLPVVELSSQETLDAVCRQGDVALVVMLGSAEVLASATEVRRRNTGRPRPKLYLLSWHHTASTATALLEQGVDQTLTLPVSITRLRRKVADLLQRTLPL